MAIPFVKKLLMKEKGLFPETYLRKVWR